MAVRGSLLVLGTWALALHGCSRSKVEEPPSRAFPSVSVAAAAPNGMPAVTLSPLLSRPAPARLVAIGDLHGDLDAARRALRLAGAIDAKDAWIGGPLVVVQTGDVIDRGDDDRKIMDLVERLKGEAKKAGGELVALSGNHELMNAELDFRYVTEAAFQGFSDVHPPSTPPAALLTVAENARGRAAAFFPTGPYAALVAERPIVMKVGDTVFVHGGVLPKHVRYGLDRMNGEVHAWLLGKRPDCPSVVTAEDSPVWSRAYSAAPGREECATLAEALTALGAKRMVVGHTVQRNGVNSACDGHVWRIDTGLSKYYGGKQEVLELRGDAATVLR